MLFPLLLASVVGPTLNDVQLYCDRVKARAWADAAPLVFPQLVAEGFRYPTGTIDPAAVGGVGSIQLRAGLAYSFIDLYRGVKTLTTADADCALESSRIDLDEALPAAADIGKATALTEEAKFLDGERPRWRNIEKIESERLAARGITYLEFDDLRKRIMQLERKSAQVRGDLSRVQAEGLGFATLPLKDVAQTYIERSKVYEGRADDARFAQAWQFRISGGLVPIQWNDDFVQVERNRVDWYALLEVQVRLGAIIGDGGYLAARDEEVRKARYEVPQKIAELRRQLDAALGQARAELSDVEEQVRFTNEAINVFEHTDADQAAHAIAMLSLDCIDLTSDRLYLQSLIAELVRTLGDAS